MDKSEIEKLAQDVKTGRITAEQGARKLMEIVYCHKAFFGLSQLDEDQIIDFVIYQYPKFITVFRIYDIGCGTFMSFLQGSVRGTYATWKKRMARNSAVSSAANSAESLLYEEDEAKYRLPEEEFILKEEKAESEALCASPGAINSFRRTDGSVSTRYKDPRIEKKRADTLRRTAVLILALKSSYFLDDSMLLKVSRYTGYSVNRLHKMCDRVNATLGKKIEHRNECIRCRDNAYYFHRKYMMESHNLNSRTTWAQFIAGKYEKQTKIWIAKNKNLSRKEYVVTATNKAVAETLGMNPRHVFYVIKQAKENVDILRPKQYYTEYETLSCNRKQ